MIYRKKKRPYELKMSRHYDRRASLKCDAENKKATAGISPAVAFYVIISSGLLVVLYENLCARGFCAIGS